MVAPVTVREKDLHTLLGIVNGHREDLPPDGLPWSLLHDLMGLIRCDVVSFTGVDTTRQAIWFDQEIPTDETAEEDAAAFWANYWDCDGFTYADRTGDLRSVIKISDFYSVRQWHSTGLYTDYFGPYGIEHLLVLVLPAGPGQVRQPGQTVRLKLQRGPGPDFSERDRALLALLRPHLHQAYLDAERRRCGAPPLTLRHWELLRRSGIGSCSA